MSFTYAQYGKDLVGQSQVKNLPTTVILLLSPFDELAFIPEDTAKLQIFFTISLEMSLNHIKVVFFIA